MLIAEFAPHYAGVTPAKSTLDKVFNDLTSEVKDDIVGALKAAHEAYRKIGYTGGFCGLQLDLITMANREFCTPSA
ncbi:unnamed protein product [Sphacelaria rigidula]